VDTFSKIVRSLRHWLERRRTRSINGVEELVTGEERSRKTNAVQRAFLRITSYNFKTAKWLNSLKNV
jgi:hypothetical protein